MLARPDFDWSSPDYGGVFRKRMDALQRIRKRPNLLPALREHYRANPADFINDWGMVEDPRLVDLGLPAMVPFILFPRQRDFVAWVLDRWRARQPGLGEKSRDCGVSTLSVALGCTLCLFNNGMVIGYGSRLAEYVDQLDNPKSLFTKARRFMSNLPREFRGGWEQWRDAPHMRINFPETGSFMGGECGDNIGRGNRTSIYFVDEAAHLARPMLAEASLASTTNCRIDISSVNGMNNPFAIKRHSGKISVFVFDWREDPRKNDAWYKNQRATLDPVVVAQEIDRDYTASVRGTIIPVEWIRSAIGADEKIVGLAEGGHVAGLDVADEGADANALAKRKGVVLNRVEEWHEKDTAYTARRAVDVCRDTLPLLLNYDCIGVGAGVKAETNRLREEKLLPKGLRIVPWDAGAGPLDPEKRVVEKDRDSPLNKDFYANLKAQGWWLLRGRFEKTHRAVTTGAKYDPDDMIAISRSIPMQMILKIERELSQPTAGQSARLKLLVNKQPDGMPSPNVGDAIMKCYHPMKAGYDSSMRWVTGT